MAQRDVRHAHPHGKGLGRAAGGFSQGGNQDGFRVTTPPVIPERKLVASPGPKRQMPFWQKALVAVFVAPPVLVILASTGLDIYGSSKLKAATREAQRKGFALSMRQYLAKQPGLSEAGNAANCYEAALSFLRAEPAPAAEAPVPLVGIVPLTSGRRLSKEDQKVFDDVKKVETDPREPMPQYVLAATKAFIERQREPINLIARGAELADCRYHVHWEELNRDLWFLWRVRQAERLLALAAWVDAEEGRPSEAAAKVREGMALAMSLRDEPDTLPALVVMSASDTVGTGLSRVVSRCDLANDDLLAIQKDCQKYDALFSMRPALEGDMAGLCDIYDALIRGRVALREYVGQLESPSPPFYSTKEDRWLTRGVLFLARGYIRADEATMIRVHMKFLEHAVDPQAPPVKRGDPFCQEMAESKMLMSVAFSGALVYKTEQAELLHAKLRATAACMAAMRYRNDNGKWPESLEALVPKYIEKAPTDPMSDKEIIYKVRDDGILVYSVGRNGVDDGGKGFVILPEKGDTGDYDDVGFRVLRQAAAPGETKGEAK